MVSEINDRLSPKNEPPITAATKNEASAPKSAAMPVAKGVSATTVPTEVPIETEIKHADRNIPGIINCCGSVFRVSDTVASIAPIP